MRLMICGIIALSVVCQLSGCKSDVSTADSRDDKSAYVDIVLPEQPEAEAPADKEMTLYVVDDNNILYCIDSTDSGQASKLSAATPAQLTEILHESDIATDCNVTIKPTLDVSYRCFIDVLDMVQIAGVSNFRIESMNAADSLALKKFSGN